MWTKPGRAEAGRFTVTNSDGALVNADAGCAGVMFYDGVSDGSTVTITSDAIGKYKWSVTVSDIVVPGTRAEVQIVATVNSIATADAFLVGRVVPADRWDSVMSDTDRWDVNVTYVSDVAQATPGDIVSDALGAWAATVAQVIPTSDAVAGAVWDEVLSDHVAANSFGKTISDVYDDTNELQTNQGNWLTAIGFSTHVPSDVASDVWNSLQAAHIAAGSFGKVASDVLAEVDGLDGAAVPSSDAIADAVWDEVQSDHVAINSFGDTISDILADTENLQANQGNWLTAIGFSTHVPSDVASDVWNSLKAAHATADTFGAYLNSDVQTAIAAGGGSAPTASDVAETVWNVRASDHTAVGSMGQALSDVYIDVAGLDGATLASSDAIADAVWDEVLTGASHNTATSAGRRLRQLGDAVAGTVDDVSATTTEFDTDLTAADDFYNDQVILFTSGSLAGQVKPILDYANASGHITLAEALTEAPANNDTFDLIPLHVHPVTQIADQVWDEDQADHVASGGFGKQISDILLDTNELQTNQGSWTTATGFSTHVPSDVAQQVLKQSVSDVEDATALNSLATVVQAILESKTTGASDWTIYKTDGTSTLATRQTTSDASGRITRVQ